MNKRIIVSVIAILIIASAIILIKNSSSKTGNIIKQPESTDVKEFTIKAFKFGYSPDSITVNKGDKVRLKINNADVLHGIRIPDLNLKGNEFVEFTANKTGEFIWYCTNMCGEGHRTMKGKLIVK